MVLRLKVCLNVLILRSFAFLTRFVFNVISTVCCTQTTSLVRCKPGVLSPGFVGMRGQGSYDYGMQDYEYTPAPHMTTDDIIPSPSSSSPRESKGGAKGEEACFSKWYYININNTVFDLSRGVPIWGDVTKLLWVF